jgi:hypothetical protein
MSRNENIPAEERGKIREIWRIIKDLLNPANHIEYVRRTTKTFEEEPLLKKRDDEKDIPTNPAEER